MQWDDHSLRKRAACSERESKRDKGAERPGRGRAAAPCPLDRSASTLTSTATLSLIHSSCEARQRAELLSTSSCRRTPSPSQRKRSSPPLRPQQHQQQTNGHRWSHAARWCGPCHAPADGSRAPSDDTTRERRGERPLDGETGRPSFRLGHTSHATPLFLILFMYTVTCEPNRECSRCRSLPS